MNKSVRASGCYVLLNILSCICLCVLKIVRKRCLKVLLIRILFDCHLHLCLELALLDEKLVHKKIPAASVPKIPLLSVRVLMKVLPVTILWSLTCENPEIPVKS